MKPPVAALILALATSVSALVFAQDQRPGTGEWAQAEEPVEAEPILAVDGEPAEPGRVPKGTSKEARELWTSVLSAIGAPPPRAESGATEKGDPSAADRPRSFELNFEVEHQRLGDEGRGTNEFDARLSYLDEGPGYVRGVILERNGVTPRQAMMQGPGYEPEFPDHWYRKYTGEGATDGWVDLRSTGFEEERELLERWCEIAFNIARLTDPKSLRIVGLTERETVATEAGEDAREGWVELTGGDRFVLPPNDIFGVVGTREKKVRDLAKGVRWLELETPDFRFSSKGLSLAQRRVAERMNKRLLFGIDPKTGLPNLVLLSPRTDGPLLAPGAVLFQTTGWVNRGGDGRRSMLPGQLIAYEARERAGSGSSFHEKASANLWLLGGGTLNGDLTADAFVPEKEK